MKFGPMQYSATIMVLVVFLVVIYLVYLVIKALRKYTKSEPVRKEKAANAKSLGEVLKQTIPIFMNNIESRLIFPY